MQRSHTYHQPQSAEIFRDKIVDQNILPILISDTGRLSRGVVERCLLAKETSPVKKLANCCSVSWKSGESAVIRVSRNGRRIEYVPRIFILKR